MMDTAAPGTAPAVPAATDAPPHVSGRAAPSVGASGGDGSGISISTRTARDADDEPLRKRARIDGGETGSRTGGMELARQNSTDSSRDVESALEEAGTEGEADVVRDERYYFPHGDCVIRVEDTLFRVHRFLLARDASAFEHMFSMPGHDDQQSRIWAEGASDARPIVLHCERAADFRALLSVMYALPSELHAYTMQHAQIPTLLTIAQTTNKYHFASTEQWAVSALHAVLTARPPPHKHYDLAYCSPALLRRVVEVALLCQHEALRDYAVGQWIQRIMAREVSPLAAMNVADEFGLVKLKGISYYAMLLASDDTLQFDAGAFDGDAEDADQDLQVQDRDMDPAPASTGLTAHQKACLLSGHYSLTHLWRRVTQAAPAFDKPPGCTYHAHGCLTTWRGAWGGAVRSEQTARLAPVDVVARLRSVDAQLVADADLQCALTPACRRAAMESVRRLCREVQEGLAGHFADLTAGG